MNAKPNPPKPEDYFLEGSEPSDDVKFLAPARTDSRLQPLVDGVETFSSMEVAIARAKSSVYLALWIFNPATRVQSALVGKGNATWADLLSSAAGRGVEVRLLLTDFDPLLQDANHRNNWRTYRKMVGVAAKLGKNKDLLQTIVSLHPAIIHFRALDPLSVLFRKELLNQLSKHIRTLNNQLKSSGLSTALDTYSNWPGLWRWVEFQQPTGKGGQFVARPKIKNLHISPVAHHQKICIVDETTAYVGGLDVNTGRIATSAHDKLNNFWHDLDARIEGAAALDVCRNFIGRWNAEVQPFIDFVKEANKTSPPNPIVLHTAKPNLKLNSTKPPSPGTARVQIQRTRSINAFIGLCPKTVQDDIKSSYERAVHLAQQFIYIENQYVRSPKLGDWIIERAQQVPDLRILIVLPVAPEEVGKTGKGDPLTEHGLYLQHELFTRLRAELKNRVGIYSLIMKIKGPGQSKTEKFGSPQIYVHSKLLLVDDLFAIIASANTNPRGFEADTEIAAAWYEPLEVQKLRLRLWREALGGLTGFEKWKAVDFITKWDKIAIANEKALSNKRQGFVIRHNENWFPGTKSKYLPNCFT